MGEGDILSTSYREVNGSLYGGLEEQPKVIINKIQEVRFKTYTLLRNNE